MRYLFLFLTLGLTFPLLAQEKDNVQLIKTVQKPQQNDFAWLMIRTDKESKLFINGQEVGLATPDELKKVPVSKGDILVELKTDNDKRETLIHLGEDDKGGNKLVELYFDSKLKGVTEQKVISENMIYVKGGTFMMGNKQGRGNEKPVHKVTVNSFYMGKYEVTVAEFKRYCEDTGADMPKEPKWGWKDEDPVVNVSWEQAMAYCKWAGGRLPTEAEWEYAARGGGVADEKFSGSEKANFVAWTYENSGGMVHPVGQLQPNELGIYDMSGNAWEWVMDNYKRRYYRKSPENNPKGPNKSPFQVLRGGSFDNTPEKSSVTHRYNFSSKGYHKTFGFRLVIPAEE